MKELWLPVKGYEGIYDVSNLGNVKSLSRSFINKRGRRKTIPEHIRIPSINHRGYYRLQLTKSNGDKKIYSVHRIVAQHFILNPENKPEVNHKNAVKTDNYINNLEWATKSENEIHASVNGLKPYGENHPLAKLNLKQVVLIKKKIKLGERQIDIAKEFDISRSTICAIKTGRNWPSVL